MAMTRPAASFCAWRSRARSAATHWRRSSSRSRPSSRSNGNCTTSRRTPVLLAVSKFGHCLIDIIHKKEIGQLPIDIVGVVSNHETMRKTAEWHGLTYHHLPMGEGKEAQEARFLAIIAESGAELTVLARYIDRKSTRLNSSH